MAEENKYLELLLTDALEDYETVKSILPSEDKSDMENIFDIISMIPGIGGAKVAKGALGMMTRKMRGMMLAKQGRKKARRTTAVRPGQYLGGSRLKGSTRDAVRNFHIETKGGAFPESLSAETLEALNTAKPSIIAAAGRTKQSSRQGLKRLIEIMGWD